MSRDQEDNNNIIHFRFRPFPKMDPRTVALVELLEKCAAEKDFYTQVTELPYPEDNPEQDGNE